MNLISIIVPFYNAEKTLSRCIESIISQTYKNFELILVNDGSSDNSKNICLEFKNRHKNIIYREKKNGGAASARNEGIKIAEGEYISFCDADDFWDKLFLEIMLNVIKKNNLITLECGTNIYINNNKHWDDNKGTGNLIIYNKIEAFERIFYHIGNVSLCTRITEAKYIKDIMIPEGRRVEDFFFTLCLIDKIGYTAVIDYNLYKYVKEDNSVTHKGGGSIYLDALYFYNISQNICNITALNKSRLFFKFKIYYLFLVSLKKTELYEFKKEVQSFKEDIKFHLNDIINEKKLKIKEKIVLVFSSIWYRPIFYIAYLKRKLF